MKISCPYCKDYFNFTTKTPQKLDCDHILCKNCINYLSYFKHPSTCPIDETIVDFFEAVQCDKTLAHLNLICSEHYRENNFLCKNHFILMCENCLSNHSKCKKLKGNCEALSDYFEELIAKSKKKASLLGKMINDFDKGANEDGLVWLREECEIEIEKLQNMKNENYERKKNQLPSYDLLSRLNDETESLKKRQFLKKSEEKPNLCPNPNPMNMNQLQEQLKNLQNLFKNPALSGSDALKNILSAAYQIPTLNQNDEKTNEEIKITRQSSKSMQFFFKTKVAEQTNKIYAAYFQNIEKNNWIVKGFGFGTPDSPSGFVYIQEMSISYESITFIYNNLDIKHTPGRVSQLILFPEPIILLPFSSIFFFIHLTGISHYMFHQQLYDDYVRVLDTDLGMFNDEFPILYLTYDYP